MQEKNEKSAPKFAYMQKKVYLCSEIGKYGQMSP